MVARISCVGCYVNVSFSFCLCIRTLIYAHSGSIIEYTWDIGGFLRRAGTARIDSEPALDTLPFQIFANIQEKSLFKKTIFSGLYFVSGVTFAGALLAWRARILRAVIFHKGNTKTKIPPKFYLQTASHPGDNAIAFSQKECSLVKGDMNSKLLLRVQGHGAWSLTTSGAYIHRKENEATKIDESSRTALIRAWRNAGGHITPSSQ